VPIVTIGVDGRTGDAMVIETYDGPRPRCRSCGDEPRPNYETRREDLGQATGVRRVYFAGDESPFDPPDDPSRRQSRDSRLWGTCYWSPRKRQWCRLENVHRIVSRRFEGTFGVRGCGFFCSIECGYRWAVRTLRAAGKSEG
jgi:hypothetical protein